MGYWLILSGWANKKVTQEQMEKRIFVGKASKPIAVIKRKEIQGYLTSELNEMYTVWSRFNLGLGLPYSSSWGDYPNRFIRILEIFISSWKEATR